MPVELASEPTTEEWNKAQRLAVAAAVAPGLRSAAEKAKSRRVARVDAQGNVVGYTTLGEVQKALLRTREIELETDDGVRPSEVLCQFCGKTVKVGKTGNVPKGCIDGCRRDCEGCGVRVSAGVARRATRLRLRRECGPCSRARARAAMTAEQRAEIGRKISAAFTPERRAASGRNLAVAIAARTPEQRSEAARKAHEALSSEQRSDRSRKAMAAKTPEQRSEAARKRAANMTPEQRSEAARKAMAAKTPEQRAETLRKMMAGGAARTDEQRSEASLKAWAGRSPEQRSEAARKANDALTPEQRAERSRKTWETRRANAAKKQAGE